MGERWWNVVNLVVLVKARVVPAVDLAILCRHYVVDNSTNAIYGELKQESTHAIAWPIIAHAMTIRDIIIIIKNKPILPQNKN